MPYLGTQPAETALTTGDLADDIVTEAKMANDSIGLAELKAGTDGELITWDASGNPAAVGAGTSGHYLKSQGAGSVPVFAAGPSAGLTFISRTTLSGTPTTLTISSGIDSTYTNYMVLLSRVRFSSSSSRCDFRWGNASGVYSANIGYNSRRHTASGTVQDFNGYNQAEAQLTKTEFDGTNSLTGGLSGRFFIFHAPEDNHTIFTYELMMASAAAGDAAEYSGTCQLASQAQGNSADITTQVQWLAGSTGTFIAGGTFDLYGIANS